MGGGGKVVFGEGEAGADTTGVTAVRERERERERERDKETEKVVSTVPEGTTVGYQRAD